MSLIQPCTISRNARGSRGKSDVTFLKYIELTEREFDLEKSCDEDQRAMHSNLLELFTVKRQIIYSYRQNVIDPGRCQHLAALSPQPHCRKILENS